MEKKRTVFLAAGGTGGHVFPAEALAKLLQARGFDVHLLTDSRGRRFVTAGAGGLSAGRLHNIAAATIASANPLRLGRSLWRLGCGFCRAWRLIRRCRPCLIIGFGGYPSLPPLLAARLSGVPIVIHEQNSVMGRANRLLARSAKAIAAGLPQKQENAAIADKIVLTGTPLRLQVLAVAHAPYRPAAAKGEFVLLVFGGSQGASFFSAIMPQALALLPAALRQRLSIIQQARAADVAALRAAYGKLGIKAEIAVFFKDLPALMAKAQFIIARAGASTVAEIAAIGRPALLVPYPNALDHDQRHNAAVLALAGGAETAEQVALTPQKLAAIVLSALENPEKMTAKAAAAAKAGERNAAEKLADLAETVLAAKRAKPIKRGAAP